MINLNSPLPEVILESLVAPAAVQNHSVHVDSDRWQKALHERGLPTARGKFATGGKITISRAEIFTIGQQIPSREGSMQLLYHALAWGLGMRASWLHLRLNGLAKNPDHAAATLEASWTAARTGASPSSVYRTLTKERGGGRIQQLGPAFGTKFMYFAEGTSPMPKHLILDRVVAGKLKKLEVWPDARTDAWAPGTYESYCQLLKQWAAEATQRLDVDPPVRADQIEMTLFKVTL